jgi:hypothetical protein
MRDIGLQKNEQEHTRIFYRLQNTDTTLELLHHKKDIHLVGHCAEKTVLL